MSGREEQGLTGKSRTGQEVKLRDNRGATAASLSGREEWRFICDTKSHSIWQVQNSGRFIELMPILAIFPTEDEFVSGEKFLDKPPNEKLEESGMQKRD